MVKPIRWIGALWLLLLGRALAQGVPCSECFPLEQLEPRLRPQAEQILLRMLDRESLYTVIGGLKPMSSGFATLTYGAEPLDKETYQQLTDLRTILRAFRCGDELYADMMVFRRTDDGKKTAHAVVVNIPAMRETIRRYADFFAKLGVTENSHPMEVVMAVEHAAPSDRHRGYGYLFGYPKYAVDFFVEAAETQQRTGQFVERDFFHVPTFERETNLFVWAVPKGHTPNEEDLAIRARAEQILNAYRARREQYIGEGKPGVMQMLRDWLRDDTGKCSLRNPRLSVRYNKSSAIQEAIMAQVCEVCGKGPMFGNSIQHKHSGQWRYRAPKTKRQWSPNLQTVRAYVNGGKTVRRIKVCTRCIKAGKVLRAIG